MLPPPSTYGDLVFLSPSGGRRFSSPESVIIASRLEAMDACLAAVEDALADGKYVAGYMAYEAGWAFLERTAPRPVQEATLLWFGVYSDPTPVPPLAAPAEADPSPCWRPSITRERYHERLCRIKEYIAAGDTYQVNFTFPFVTQYEGDPWQWFQQLFAGQPTEHAAYLNLGDRILLSLSPELFFRLEGDRLTTRPMKGTRPRGLYPEADACLREDLRRSEKDQAENVMIVDLLRNDMGRISDIGSVHVASLFDIERYRTVWQMTSTIQSRTTANFSSLFRALFPCGSVTGAPKIRTMEIIGEAEEFPRGAYCGSIGWWGPGRHAVFNVAIRTITLDRSTRMARYCVGGGITWGSRIEEEYDECLAKVQAVVRPAAAFELIETLLFDGNYYLLEEHLDRLCASADHLDFEIDRNRVRCALQHYAGGLPSGRWKVRLLLSRNGACAIEHAPAPQAHGVLRTALASVPVDKRNPLLYHKTTRREIYEQARNDRPEADEVLLWNEAGELTEGAVTNLVVMMDNGVWTPPVSCGLLPGVLRGVLLQSGLIRERILTPDDLPRARAVYLINSVRGWMQAVMMDPRDPATLP